MAAVAQITVPRLRISCSNPRNNRRRPPPARRNAPRKVKIEQSDRLSPLPGSEATTYARLPPKEDFSLPNFPNSSEITLRDFAQQLLVNRPTDDASDDGLDDGTKLISRTEFVVNRLLDDDDIGEFLEEGVPARARRFNRAKVVVNQLLDDEGDDFDDDNVDEDDIDEDTEEEGVPAGTRRFDQSKLVVNQLLDDDNDDEDDDFDATNVDNDVKEKGVPAVMRCFDEAKIYVKAGDGGNGVVAFRREKFVPFGGPSGGDGGRGGNVYVEVDGSMNSLLPFRKNVHFRAGRGAHGQGRKQAGAKGEDVVVRVPPGTVVREAGRGGVEGEVLLELMEVGQRALLLPGGRGGRGNASFKSGTLRVPKIAENGEEGAEMWLDLELKLVADVGIVGAPNAGKSTLLSAISAAQPTIANYPFTTLLPNLGVVSLDFDATMVVADLPGLLEGAHRGFGLGHEFLRHTERCSVLVHVVDGSGEQPLYEFDAVRLELELFNPELSEKPFLVAYNKMDLPEAYEKWESFRQGLEDRGISPHCISAIGRQGTHDLISTAYRLLQSQWMEMKAVQESMVTPDLDHVAERIQRLRGASMNEFEVYKDEITGTWFVVGAGIQRFVQMTNWQYAESLRRFQHALEACGVNKTLLKRGVKEGDTVIIGEMEMIWHDSPSPFGLSGDKKKAPSE